MNDHPAPRAPKVLTLTLKHRENQEHLLRRLGQAVVLHWEELSDSMQDLLIDQAVAVQDREADVPHSVTDIENFIRSVKTVTPASPPPAP